MDIKNFERNSDDVSAGLWVDEIPGMGDLRLKVRGLSSPEVVALRSRREMAEPPESYDKNGRLKPEVLMRIFGEVLHEIVLLDWDNVVENGKKLPYSKEQAIKWCTDRNFMPFADAVAHAASRVDRGFVQSGKALEKNSERPSSGKSSTGPLSDD